MLEHRGAHPVPAARTDAGYADFLKVAEADPEEVPNAIKYYEKLEKSSRLADKNRQMVFEVRPDATKPVPPSNISLLGLVRQFFMARYLGARHPHEIIFTRGTTEGINLVARTYAAPRLGEGDEILITAMEHHSNIVPWQMLCDEKGATLRVIPVNDQGELLIEEYERERNVPAIEIAAALARNLQRAVGRWRGLCAPRFRSSRPVPRSVAAA